MGIDTNVIDAIIAVSMAFMAVSLMLLVATLMSVLMKSVDTLGAIQRLCNTVDQEIGPTAVELREIMSGLSQLKGATTQRITAVGHKVEDVAGNINTAVDKAQKHSTVMGTGLLAGFRAYLSGQPHNEGREKQITMDKHESKGEQ